MPNNHANTILAYHGTSPESAEMILEPGKATAERFLISENDTDWLGNGVYFFQDAPYRAKEWPRIRQPPPRRTLNPVVLCAEIDLTDCLDLIDIKAAKEIMYWYPHMKSRYRKTKEPFPKNTKGGKGNLDNALINHAIEKMEARGQRINTVRAAFTEGWALVPGSRLYSHAHVQIVVRPYRMEVIKNVWLHRF